MWMKWRTLSIAMSHLVPVLGVLFFAAIALWTVLRRRAIDATGKSAWREAIKNDLAEPVTMHPFIDPARCAGCGACVKVCPEGDILQLIDHKAVLVAPTKCVGHGECEQACPFAAISLVFGTKKRGMELPRVTGNYETNVPGLYIAGELGGMGLIRNAVKQGRLAAEHALNPAAKRETGADFDLLIVGAGAAGLSAGLAAIAAKRRYLLIEQNSVGGTIANFPRQKVVMSQPANLPMVGAMKFPKHRVTKEELLDYWARVRHETGLKVREGCQFLSLAKDQSGLFRVETSLGPVKVAKVILAMGVRGTPRRLGLPNEDLPKVTYNLIEPDQYQGCDIAIVGSGNAGGEAAMMLADPRLRNRVHLLVRSAAFSRMNQENQDNLKALARAGHIRIFFKTEVKEIHADHLMVEKEGTRHPLKNDFLFIFAGAEMPSAFLTSLGIKIEKKFGEARGRS